MTIDKSHVTLRGENAGTKLILVDGLTDVAVVYVNGDGKENIVVKDFYINGNAATQTSTGFICNGVLVRGNVANNFPKNVVVSGMVIENCRRMGVMMFADGGKVLDCHFSGNFGSHVVEVLGRNCIIDRCSLLIANGIIADYGFGIDSCDNFIISNNLIRIEAGAVIS